MGLLDFENREVLIALSAAFLPLVVYLILRRKAKHVPLDAVMVLVLSKGATAVRLRFAQRVLLLVRMLLLALLVLTFARPYLLVPAEAGLVAEEPMSVAIVLDDSVSMRVNVGGSWAWDEAIRKARKALRELPPESDVYVVLASKPPLLQPTRGPGWDARSAERLISRLAPSYKASDLTGAMRLAANAVLSSPRREKVVLVISDFFKQPPELATVESLIRSGISWRLVKVGPQGPVRNLSVTKVTADMAPDVGKDYMRIKLTIDNDSDERAEPIVTIRMGMHSVARTVSCEAKRTCEEEFLLILDPGATYGEARLPPDDFEPDNVRFFPVQTRRGNSVLIVNGAPRRRPDLDEAFFLARALPLSSNDHPGFEVRTVTEPSGVQISTASVVALLNVGTVERGTAETLLSFVEKGGGLFVSAGDNAQVGGWGSGLFDLLPAPLRDVVDLGSGDTIEWLDKDSQLGDWRGLRGLVKQVAILEPGWPQGTRILARTGSGLPLLVERPLGRGTILVWLTSADRDWTDLPLRPDYAPFFRAVFAYLTKNVAFQQGGDLTVGDPRRIEVSDQPVTVIAPGGSSKVFERSGVFQETDMPGAYKVSGPAEEVFVVNVDPNEGRFRLADEWLRLFPATGNTELRPGKVLGRKVPLATYLAGLLLALLVVETWLRSKA